MDEDSPTVASQISVESWASDVSHGSSYKPNTQPSSDSLLTQESSDGLDTSSGGVL